MNNPQNGPAPLKSSNKKEAAVREKNKSLLNFTNSEKQKEEKSHDPSFEGVSNSENDHDMGIHNNASQHHLGGDDQARADESKSHQNASHREVPTCAVCGRTFNSMKAMHGHLRSHPNKGYKGAVPPPNIAKEKLLQPSSTSAPQMEIPVSKQPVSAKRDCTSTPKRDPNQLIDPTTEAMNAAFILVYLRIGTSEKETHRSPKRKRKNIENDSRVIKDNEETAEEHLRNGEGYEGKDHSNDYQADGDDERECIEESYFQPLSSLIKKEKKAKKSTGFYICGICNKIFSTHQALGGHMASHNKSKNITDEAFTADEANEVEKSHIEKPTIERALKGSDSGIHKCKTCGKVFASGQALGGHQRKHYPLPDHGRKGNNVALTQDRKDSNVAPNHGQKKSSPNHIQKESNDASDDRRKGSNVVPDHDRKESNIMRDIDLNKSADSTDFD